MARPCFCSLADRSAHQLFPVHFFWPLVRKRVRAGELLFPSYYGAKVNNAIKAVLRTLSVPYAAHYSSHGFRRGASNELKTRMSQWSTVATLGERRSLAFRGRVDLTTELNRDMSKLLDETDTVESDLEDQVRSSGAGPS